MTWLIGQVWLWMVLSALCGAVLTTLASVRRIRIERVVETPVVTREPAAESPVAVAVEAAAEAEEPPVQADDFPAPFPEFRGGSASRPWEAEELWSRPARVEAGTAASGPRDEWGEAAANWRSWAHEVSGKAPVVDEPTAALPSPIPAATDEPWSQPVVDPFPVFPGGGSPSFGASEYDDYPHAEPVEAPSTDRAEDGFPHATPVDASPSADQERRELEGLVALRLEAERVEAERLEAERVEAERLEAERLEAERLEAERLEVERLEAERLELERLEVERREAERLQAERQEAERLEAERLEAERLEAERLEVERLEAERLELERREAERLEAERQEAERLEAERLEAERLEVERLEAERREAERLDELRGVSHPLRAELPLDRDALDRVRARGQGNGAPQAEAPQETTEVASRPAGPPIRLSTLTPADLAAVSAAGRIAAGDPADEAVGVSDVDDPAGDDAAYSRPAKLEPFARRPRRSTPAVEERPAVQEGPYGPGSAWPPFDGSAPVGYPIKGSMSTKLYHSRRSRFYSRTQADVWFDTEARARAAGFTRWDQRGTMAHVVLHKSISDEELGELDHDDELPLE